MNVRVNGVAPGVVMTPMAMTLGEEGVRCAWANDHLGGKPIYPADVSAESRGQICRRTVHTRTVYGQKALVSSHDSFFLVELAAPAHGTTPHLVSRENTSLVSLTEPWLLA